MTLFPVIRDWIAEFLLEIRDMTASEIGRNMLIEQVTLVAFLVQLSGGSRGEGQNIGMTWRERSEGQ